MLAALAWAAAGGARAGDLVVSVVNPAGRPVADAVVMVTPEAGSKGRQMRFPWPMVVEQRDMKFQPFVLIVPVGAEVSFPNHDPFRHHVYSFSPAKTFELKLYGHDETRTVRFDKAGVVALGCNIHDDMTGFIRVVETPFAAKTGVGGEVRITGIPAGEARLAVWHPYVRGGRDVARTIVVAADGTAVQKVVLDVRPAPMKHGGY